MPDVPAFWWCRAWPAATSEQELAVGWPCRRITEHRGTGLRISPLLEWVEWTDEFLHPAWREVGYDDSSWPAPAAVPVTALPAARSVPASVQLPTWPARKVKPAAVGVYRDTYTGYMSWMTCPSRSPSPTWRHAQGQDIDGVWQPYDLGRVRIGALELDVWTAAGGAVTVAYGEKLSQGRPGRPGAAAVPRAHPDGAAVRRAGRPVDGRTRAEPWRPAGRGSAARR